MSPLHCWITLLTVAGGILLVPTQGRRLRHASWLSGGERCTRCPPGWGVERRCGAGRDTACTPCRPGERFAAHHSARSPCLTCSRCGPGLFAARACTPTHDTKCAACYPPPAATHRNADFRRQCTGLIPDQDDNDDEPMMADAPRSAPKESLATYGLSPLPARSKTDMARSILADPGQVQGPTPHALLGDPPAGPPQQQQYSLLAAPGQALAGPAYSVLTDDGPVSPAPPRRPPRPRHPVRLSSPISWGRPSAPSVNTQQRIKVSAPTTELPLALHHHTEEGDISAEEVGRLML